MSLNVIDRDSYNSAGNDFVSYYNKSVKILSSGDVKTAIQIIQNGLNDCCCAHRCWKDRKFYFVYDRITYNKNDSLYVKLRNNLSFLSLNNNDLDAVIKADKIIIRRLSAILSSLDKIIYFYNNLKTALTVLSPPVSGAFHIIINKTIIDTVDDLVGILPKTLNWNKLDPITKKLRCVDLRPKIHYSSGHHDIGHSDDF